MAKEREVRERVTRWFVEPLDGQTNQNAIFDLVRLCNATEENIYSGKKDQEGEEHDVVEVNHHFVTRMECNAAKFEHKFRVYTQVGGAAMRLWPFGKQKKLARSAEVRRMADDLNARVIRRSEKAQTK